MSNFPISGTTRVVVHLAYPSHHLRTPGLFNALCQERGLNAVLVPWQVPPQGLAEAVAGLRGIENLAGVIVTIPHKTAISALCDSLSSTARFLGVANVVRRDSAGRFHGEMFDGRGLVLGLRERGHDVAGRQALLVGAGGAAAGIAEALLGAGVASLTLSNRSAPRAEALAARLRAAFAGRAIRVGPGDATGADLVVNGTSLGMYPGDALPVDVETLDPGTLVAEAVMEPDVTPLLKAAAARGCQTHRGVHMITGQIGLLVDFLLGASGGQPPDAGAARA
ncbi:shikimate dehydrogenase family protein [Paenirhodobacter populi]|uniref:shikimate dehydrogenase (NADP(+)) n=1 Tax=Paenirhodobacter populi TaxID=2306993 RepID=A0A443IRW9_9RHOB|nr:shikimate dehydrogenase [Sinirhodobacter populi]RWR09241.1 shikimate dehydrogenase [Sinirhodobacter populi]